jgi:hypothetical protein
MRRTWFWTALGVVAVAGTFLTLPGARTEVNAGPIVNATRFTGFRCYAAKNAKGFKFNKTVLYAVADQLGGANATQLTKPATVCVPAEAQTEPGPPDGLIPIGPAIVCFKSKDPKGTPKPNPPAFMADDALGMQDLSLGKGNLFCVQVFAGS